jgi:hypothetical protein
LAGVDTATWVTGSGVSTREGGGTTIMLMVVL